MNTIHVKSWVSCAAFFGALFFSTVVFAAPIEVKLEVDAANSKLKVISNDSPCDGPTDSCINVKKNSAPFIKFTLADACTTGTNIDYQLTGVRISLIEKVWPTASNPLSELVAKDFKADPETGEIKFGGNNEKKDYILKFKNRNSHGYTVYYEVSAEPCKANSNLDDIFLDPEIRNKGRG
jgi:hypothetical protein